MSTRSKVWICVAVFLAVSSAMFAGYWYTVNYTQWGKDHLLRFDRLIAD